MNPVWRHWLPLTLNVQSMPIGYEALGYAHALLSPLTKHCSSSGIARNRPPTSGPAWQTHVLPNESTARALVAAIFSAGGDR